MSFEYHEVEKARRAIQGLKSLQLTEEATEGLSMADDILWNLLRDKKVELSQ